MQGCAHTRVILLPSSISVLVEPTVQKAGLFGSKLHFSGFGFKV